MNYIEATWWDHAANLSLSLILTLYLYEGVRRQDIPITHQIFKADKKTHPITYWATFVSLTIASTLMWIVTLWTAISPETYPWNP